MNKKVNYDVLIGVYDFIVEAMNKKKNQKEVYQEKINTYINLSEIEKSLLYERYSNSLNGIAHSPHGDTNYRAKKYDALVENITQFFNDVQLTLKETTQYKYATIPFKDNLEELKGAERKTGILLKFKNILAQTPDNELDAKITKLIKSKEDRYLDQYRWGSGIKFIDKKIFGETQSMQAFSKIIAERRNNPNNEVVIDPNYNIKN